MGKLLLRLRRRLVHLFSRSANSITELQFSRVFIQNPLHKPGTPLSFAGTCPAIALSLSNGRRRISRQMKDLDFSGVLCASSETGGGILIFPIFVLSRFRDNLVCLTPLCSVFFILLNSEFLFFRLFHHSILDAFVL